MPTPDPMNDSLRLISEAHPSFRHPRLDPRVHLLRMEMDSSHGDGLPGQACSSPAMTTEECQRNPLIISIPEDRARFFKPAAQADGGDAPREAGTIIGLNRKAAQRGGPERRLELGARNAPDEPGQRFVLHHPDARIVVARHAHVGYEGGAAREHLMIGGGHMGMGA